MEDVIYKAATLAKTKLLEDAKRSTASFEYLAKVLSDTTLEQTRARIAGMTDDFIDQLPQKPTRAIIYSQLLISYVASLVYQKSLPVVDGINNDAPPATGNYDIERLHARQPCGDIEPFSIHITQTPPFKYALSLLGDYERLRALLQLWFSDTDTKSLAIHGMVNNIEAMELSGALLAAAKEGEPNPDIGSELNRSIESSVLISLLEIFAVNKTGAAEKPLPPISSDTYQ